MGDYADEIAEKLMFSPSLLGRMRKGYSDALVEALAIAVRAGYNLRDGVGS